MRSDLTAVEQSEALSLPAQEKDAAEGQKKARGRRTSGGRSCALVPEEKARSGRPAGDRDKAGVEGHSECDAVSRPALHTSLQCSTSDTVNDQATRWGFRLSFTIPSHGSREANGAPPPKEDDAVQIERL